MAPKNNRTRSAAPAPDPEVEGTPEVSTEVQSEPAVPAVPARPAAEVAAELFAKYDEAVAHVAAVKAETDKMNTAAAVLKSNAVKAILDGTGRSTFTLRGVEVTIVARETKPKGDESGYTTYFLKGKKEKEAPLEVY